MTNWTIRNQDVLEWAKTWDGKPFHAMLCDPPYELKFMSKKWDGTGVAFNPETWLALSRHLYSGAFIMVYAGSRTQHRVACAIEDAGFVIHPTISMLWINGQGFPKATRIKDHAEFDGHRYGLQALKPSVEYIIVAQKPYEGRPLDSITLTGAGALNIDGGRIGTGNEILKETVDYGRRGIPHAQEDGGRPWIEERISRGVPVKHFIPSSSGRWPSNLILCHLPACEYTNDEYLCADGCPIKALDEQTGILKSGDNNVRTKEGHFSEHGGLGKQGDVQIAYADKGGASRFFFQADWSYETAEQIENAMPFQYVAKASRSERDAGLEQFPPPTRGGMQGTEDKTLLTGSGNERNNMMRNPHPTVKPIRMSQYLATLLLPPDRYSPRRILNPFSGSSSEAIGAMRAGWEEIVMVESDTENGYVDISEARMKYWYGLTNDKPKQKALL